MILFERMIPQSRRPTVAGMVSNAVPNCNWRRTFYAHANRYGLVAAIENIAGQSIVNQEWLQLLREEIEDVISELESIQQGRSRSA